MVDLTPPSDGDGSGMINMPIFTVGEISSAIKRTIEDNFGRVRVRGEISGLRRPASGHVYMDLKDTDGVIAGVCWRGAVNKLSISPEDGMEIIVTGRITTYGPQSKYQLVIEGIELAGEGALLKLIEDRKKMLALEGLFDDDRKQELPFLPEVIGVVTSMTGAVIRDILHRLDDRFPRHVVIWPVLVQGKGAADQITNGINGFNALPHDGPIARPDLIIVARGGGSIEDLMAFNEENVVRAAAGSDIPLISAVGHETDYTLIDFASDVRAPTPSAAAEMAVPVRLELASEVADFGARLNASVIRMLEDQHRHLVQLWRIAGDPTRMMEEATQRLDDRGERLHLAGSSLVSGIEGRFNTVAARLRPQALQLGLAHGADRLTGLGLRLTRETGRILGDRGERLDRFSALLASYSYENVLARGFAVIRDSNGDAIMKASDTEPDMAINIGFSDGDVPAVLGGKSGSKKSPPRKRARDGGDKDGGAQGSLL
ncbi:MAG: exodeoxyribonuclease VII large subunit [Rhodospirillales bacterium]|nr:exodeoxyribonuclease VII large subunit [Rhodospirillales bacterium]MBT5075240.1 exodeoxyribonuclease VII large subunit [Rhodospirillales bacterium]MBT5113969.1 exodeoxyribonuclease VII large subunit [Rhodospirillales bacterium]MBT5672497.1 exodeoxyribonuclease VII large subunit [Rhodospirillales bacterium]MBT6185834.1 exodeoxyribonuclease VII large subunit [Rhodospirillales bacterium]